MIPYGRRASNGTPIVAVVSSILSRPLASAIVGIAAEIPLPIVVVSLQLNGAFPSRVAID
jgi:hypothetical protein